MPFFLSLMVVNAWNVPGHVALNNPLCQWNSVENMERLCTASLLPHVHGTGFCDRPSLMLPLLPQIICWKSGEGLELSILCNQTVCHERGPV